MDFGHLPNGQYIMVVMDDYSHYPFVEVINSTAATTVIPKLDNILAMRGIPEVIKTDNDPPFSSHAFHQYAISTGFRHRKITPLWPRANAEVERFMGMIKKVIRAATAQSQDWQQEMQNFLLSYRATPHSTTRVAPATVLFGSSIRNKIPEIITSQNDNVRSQDALGKLRMKYCHNQKANIKPSAIKPGDNVLVRDPSLSRTTPFCKTPLQVVQRKGSMVTAGDTCKTVTRNVSFFSKSSHSPDHCDVPSDSEEEEDEQTRQQSDSTLDVAAHPQAHSAPRTDPAAEPQPLAAQALRPQRIRRPPLKLKDYVKY